MKPHDERLEGLLARQITDPASRWLGGVPDETGLCHANMVGGLLKNAAAATFHPKSVFHQDTALFARMRLAADFLNRCQTADGNVDLLTTNFNSPPDTGFVEEIPASA